MERPTEVGLFLIHLNLVLSESTPLILFAVTQILKYFFPDKESVIGCYFRIVSKFIEV